MQQQTKVGVGDVLVNIACPVFHAGFKVLGEQGHDGIHAGAVLFVSVHGVLTLEFELSTLHQPAHDACVDCVFLRLCRLGGNTANLTGLMHHFQEQTRSIGHADAWGVHFRVNDASRVIDIEFLFVLRVRQARHKANTGDAAVRAHIAIHACGSAQRGVCRLAVYDHFFTAFVDHEVAGSRPLQRGVVQLAEPLE